MSNKIEIKKIINCKKNKKKIVLCHGVFDVLHTGHLKYFSQAKKLGHILVVSVTSDKFVNKGPLRPINKLSERIMFLRNIVDVDFVLESNNLTSVKIINKIRPDFYCKGPDYKFSKNKDKNLKDEIKAVKKNNGKFVTVEHISRSSTKIIQKQNMIGNNFEILTQIKKIKKKYSFDSLISSIKDLKNKKVLVLGELIIDKYILAEAIGKSGKDPMLVFKELRSEKYLGGTAYIANLCSSFSKTFCISHLGEIDSQENYIKKNINKNINYFFLKKKNSPTLTKLRYLDHYKKNKIIGFYNIDDRNLSKIEEKKFLKLIKKHIHNSDVIILADYGHGEITPTIRKEIQKHSKKLFLNTQINSFNSRHHTLKKYKKVNTLCINESELRYEMKDNKSSITDLYKKLKREIKFKNLIITRGKFGSILIKNNKIFNCPAFETSPLDTIGSGDTFFSLSSLLLSQNSDPDIALTFASLASGFSVRNLGHKRYYNFNDLEADIKDFFQD